MKLDNVLVFVGMNPELRIVTEIRSKSVFSTSPSGCWTSSTLICRLLHVLVVIQLPTHRGKKRFPGMTITYTLIQMVEKIAEKYDKSTIITKARVTELIMSVGTCTKCIYEKVGISFNEFGTVIFTSGRFGVDFAQNSLLTTYRPDLLHLTTNG